MESVSLNLDLDQNEDEDDVEDRQKEVFFHHFSIVYKNYNIDYHSIRSKDYFRQLSMT